MDLLPPEKGPYAGSEPLPLWVVRVWEPEPPAKQEAQRAFVPSRKHGSARRQQPQSQQVEALEWILRSRAAGGERRAGLASRAALQFKVAD